MNGRRVAHVIQCICRASPYGGATGKHAAAAIGWRRGTTAGGRRVPPAGPRRGPFPGGPARTGRVARPGAKAGGPLGPRPRRARKGLHRRPPSAATPTPAGRSKAAVVDCKDFSQKPKGSKFEFLLVAVLRPAAGWHVTPATHPLCGGPWVVTGVCDRPHPPRLHWGPGTHFRRVSALLYTIFALPEYLDPTIFRFNFYTKFSLYVRKRNTL